MVKILAIWFLILSCNLKVFPNLESFGETFEIIEKDLIEVIKDKLKILEADGSLSKHQSKLKKQLIKSAKNPKPVENIKDTTKARSFVYDPSFFLNQDLKDDKGQVFYKKGSLINPLNYQSLNKPLLFIDGDQQKQIDWALCYKKINPNYKIILVKGSPFKLMEALNFPIYFDQFGVIVKKLGIEFVPARVVQKGKMLQVFEELA